MAISQPPPRAWPLMAATTGLGKRSMRRTTLLPKRMKVAMSGPEKAEPRSAPAQKILSPAPVMMTDLTASSFSTSDRAEFSSFMSSALMAFAGGRFSVMTAKLSSRARIRVSYGMGRLSSLLVGGDTLQKQIRDGISGIHETILALAQHPRGGHLVHGAEEHLRGDLDRQVRAEPPRGHALLEHGADQGEVRPDLLARRAAEEFLALPQLDLDDLGQLGISLQEVEMQVDESAHLGHGIRLIRHGLPELRHELRHLLAEQRGEDVFLRLEIEVDGAGGDSRLTRDVGDARVEIALPGEDPDRGFDDLLGLVGIAHGRTMNRRSF